MALTLEVCTLEERCLALESKYENLVELREKLREWLRASPYLPQEIPDTKLEVFLLNSKLSLERAKSKLDIHYTIRRLVPEIYANRDPLSTSLIEIRNCITILPLTKLTPENNRAIITKYRNMTIVDINFWDYLKYTFMVADILIFECHSMGEIHIHDLAGIKLNHLIQVTPTIMKKFEVIAMKAYGPKIAAIHFINAPSFIDRIINLLKSVLKKKISERIHVHASIESLYNFVPKSILPMNYGGNEISTEELHKKWEDKLIDKRDWYLNEENVLTNEALRPGPTVNPDDLFGTYGSFRKLDVD